MLHILIDWLIVTMHINKVTVRQGFTAYHCSSISPVLIAPRGSCSSIQWCNFWLLELIWCFFGSGHVHVCFLSISMHAGYLLFKITYPSAKVKWSTPKLDSCGVLSIYNIFVYACLRTLEKCIKHLAADNWYLYMYFSILIITGQWIQTCY